MAFFAPRLPKYLAALFLVPLLWTFAYPGGLIPQADYAALKTEFLDRLTQAMRSGPLDGVLLDLHGIGLPKS